KGIVQKLRIFVSAKKAHDFIMMVCQRAPARISCEFVGKIQMQSDIQFIFFRQLRRALGILHENHRTDRRSPPSFITSKGGIGFRHRAAPIVSIDDKHSIGEAYPCPKIHGYSSESKYRGLFLSEERSVRSQEILADLSPLQF